MLLLLAEACWFVAVDVCLGFLVVDVCCFLVAMRWFSLLKYDVLSLKYVGCLLDHARFPY